MNGMMMGEEAAGVGEDVPGTASTVLMLTAVIGEGVGAMGEGIREEETEAATTGVID